jgi:hypothetical protein
MVAKIDKSLVGLIFYCSTQAANFYEMSVRPELFYFFNPTNLENGDYHYY